MASILQKPDKEGQIKDLKLSTRRGALHSEYHLGVRFLFLAFMTIIGLAIFAHPAGSFFLDKTMVLLSFRAEPNHLVRLSDEGYKTMAALADADKAGNIVMPSCRLSDDHWLIGNVTVVWHGVGGTAYVRIHGKTGGGLLVAIPNSDLTSVPADPPEGKSVLTFKGNNGGACAN